MSYSYPNSTNADAYRPVRRDYYTDSSHDHSRLVDTLPPWLRQWVAELHAHWIAPSFSITENSRGGYALTTRLWRIFRHIFTVTNALAVLWFFTLWWGERAVFQDSLERCAWENWEQWPRDATPHHVAFIADPQLVDPHTYPGRPWPLSTLTVKFTDQYLRRSFSSIQRNLGPDSVLFLGDLFDGGREWATSHSSSPEKRYQKYKDSFWKNEYHRFVKIFSNQWNEGDSHSGNPHGRRMIASLPGNHDLGFGTGVQLPVRDRFQTYFGQSNRVDVIGNHTFVSVDTVSLSAMDQPDPETGSSGSGDGHPPNEHIWKEAEDFLNSMNVHRGKAEMEELRLMRNQTEGHVFDHKVVDLSQPTLHQRLNPEVVGFPAILLTHVPLYRKPATPCGPLREHYPPSDGEPEEDDRNALSISAGYQYQNVLTQTISKDLVTKAGPNLVHIYSGDDHDYCEVTHRQFSGSPKEITVKSLSWAMGVRRPGFLLTSLWNPVDPATGKPTHSLSTGATLQNHLCLLPDQLSIFIRYGLLFGLTLAVLLARAAILVLYFPAVDSSAPILPLSEFRPTLHVHTAKAPSSSTSSSTFSSPGGLASRAVNAPPRYPKVYGDTYPGAGHDDVDNAKWKPRVPASRGIWGEFMNSVKYVATIVFAWYFFLIWRW
ncbi:hypothetical protein BDV24DRAFT_122174 [Aspergillus arachidicola]|uniref:Calcineurin-like phosphoesterase domain-containing protein n=1 Tax=Aspergillus arachidicola TaxID=656916 RepID=A0A5N6YSU4_9EURO|nr:hypothetical protein BDV24DRAFT_122174 [Aspergillus arachidicola]